MKNLFENRVSFPGTSIEVLALKYKVPMLKTKSGQFQIIQSNAPANTAAIINVCKGKSNKFS